MYKYSWILSFFVCSVFFNLNAQPVDVPQAEYDALVVLYDSTNGRIDSGGTGQHDESF